MLTRGLLLCVVALSACACLAQPMMMAQPWIGPPTLWAPSTQPMIQPQQQQQQPWAWALNPMTMQMTPTLVTPSTGSNTPVMNAWNPAWGTGASALPSAMNIPSSMMTNPAAMNANHGAMNANPASNPSLASGLPSTAQPTALSQAWWMQQIAAANMASPSVSSPTVSTPTQASLPSAATAAAQTPAAQQTQVPMIQMPGSAQTSPSMISSTYWPRTMQVPSATDPTMSTSAALNMAAQVPFSPVDVYSQRTTGSPVPTGVVTAAVPAAGTPTFPAWN